MSLAIGVDIGGTKVAAGIVDETGQVIDRERRDTPDDVAHTEDAIVEVVELLAARHDVVAVGIGAAGWVANDNATVLFSPHLAWRDQPLRAHERRLGVAPDRVRTRIALDAEIHALAQPVLVLGMEGGAAADRLQDMTQALIVLDQQ